MQPAHGYRIRGGLASLHALPIRRAMQEPRCRLVDWWAAGRTLEYAAQVEDIFWQTSGRTLVGPERDAFRERWLGRYMLSDGDVVLLALVEDAVAGYLVGALHNPAEQERFTDIGYFRGAFAALMPRYPAHLHINLAAPFRGRGIGGQLVAGFAERARRAGAPGMHVVTGRAMRNVRFYLRCGFIERAAAPWNRGTVVLLGKDL
jgi:GNAT superfamily N-acetyltransferase